MRFSETSRLEERVSSSGCEAKVAWDISKPSLLRVRSDAAGVEKGAKGFAGAILCDGLGGRERQVDRILGSEGEADKVYAIVVWSSYPMLMVVVVDMVGKVGLPRRGCIDLRTMRDSDSPAFKARVWSTVREV